MTKFKKLALLCTALLTSLSLGVFAACDMGTDKTESSLESNSASISSSVEETSSSVEPESSSVSESASSNDSSSIVNSSSVTDSSSSTDESSSAANSSSSSDDSSSADDSSSSSDDSSSDSSWVDDGTCEHVWSEWELVSDPTCTVDGVKVRYCLHNEEHVNYGSIAMRGHNYGNEAVCVRCGVAPILRTDHTGAVYTQVEDCETLGDPSSAKGSEYNRYELTEGYYTVEALKSGIWISVSVDGAGQYALHTIGGASGVEITRYDASAQYITLTSPYPAQALGDNDFLSVVNCGDAYWNPAWRATWKIRANRATEFSFVIEKIDDPAWQPAYVKTSVIAQQINGVYAPEGPENTVLAEVPYDAQYFLDTELGYYRMGTPEKPGAIIYAAITKVPPRLLYDRPFSQIEYQGSNLTLGDGYGFGDAFTVDGDYNLLYYPPFIMMDTSYNGTPGNCYEQFVNSDGVYPVNEELFKFLNLYVFNKKPFDENIPSEDFINKADYMWLSACYYYAELTPGTKEYPMELTTGENSVHLPDFDSLYCNFKGDGYYTVSSDTEGVVLLINNTRIASPFAVTIVADAYGGKAFELSAENFVEMDAVVTIEKAIGLLNYTGSMDAGVSPVYVTPDGDGNVTLETITVYGSDISYFSHFCYEITAVGTYTFKASVENKVLLQVEGNSLDATTTEVTIVVTEEFLAEGLPIQIYLMADAETSVDVNVSYSEELPEVLPETDDESEAS